MTALKHHFPLGPAQGVFPCTKATSIYNTAPLRKLITDNWHGKLVWPMRVGSPDIIQETIAIGEKVGTGLSES